MQWQLSDEQVAYQETLRDWLSDVAGPAVVRGWLDEGDSATFVGRLVDAGWAGVGVPEEQGGQGGGLVELALTAEQFGATAVPGAAWLTTVLALPALQGLPDVAEAALAGEHPAMLHPAEALPYRIPRLSMSADGAVSGRVERVLAGAGAACYLVVVDGVDGPALPLYGPSGPGEQHGGERRAEAPARPQSRCRRRRSRRDAVGTRGRRCGGVPRGVRRPQRRPDGRRLAGGGDENAGAGGHLQQTAPSVRGPHRILPGGAARSRNHPRRRGGGPFGRLLRRRLCRRGRARFGPPRRGDQGAGHRLGGPCGRQRTDAPRRDRIHVGARPAPVLQAFDAQPGPVRHAEAVERRDRGPTRAGARRRADVLAGWALRPRHGRRQRHRRGGRQGVRTGRCGCRGHRRRQGRGGRGRWRRSSLRAAGPSPPWSTYATPTRPRRRRSRPPTSPTACCTSWSTTPASSPRRCSRT